MYNYVDKRGLPIEIGDFVMIGLKSNGMGQIGEIHIGQVMNMNAHGVGLEGQVQRVKVAHRMTKVSESFYQEWVSYQ